MAAPTKDARLGLRIAEDELQMLTALAAEAERSAADTVRRLIRDAYRARFGEKPATRKKGAR